MTAAAARVRTLVSLPRSAFTLPTNIRGRDDELRPYHRHRDARAQTAFCVSIADDTFDSRGVTKRRYGAGSADAVLA